MRFFVLCLALPLISLLILPTTSIDSYKVEGKISFNAVLKNISQLEPATKVMLDGGRYTTWIRKNGKFVINDVPSGSYLLEVLSRKYIYPKIRLDVDSGGVRPFVTITGSEWGNLGPSLPYPLELYARTTADYFTPREGFSIFSLFANPYIIMMGFSVVLLFFMPKMMAGLDQEALQELQQNQSQNPLEMPDISSTIANYLTSGSNDKAPNKKN